MNSQSLAILWAAVALLMVDSVRLNKLSAHAADAHSMRDQSLARAGHSQVQAAVQDDPAWIPISRNAACRTSYKTYHNYTLDMCKDACNALDGCIAIDFMSASGERLNHYYVSVAGDCLLYSSACGNLLSKEDEAFSYALRAPCDGYSCPAGYVLKPDGIGRSSSEETCCERPWTIINASAACSKNSEDVRPWWTTQNWPPLTLDDCKAKCDEKGGACVAIDYFSINGPHPGKCIEYDKACTTPLATIDGASSYMHQGTQSTCRDYHCPWGYSLKAGGDIVGQGRDVATCCVKDCSAVDCSCFVRDAVVRNSAWRRWDGVTCKCISGSTLDGDSEVCTGSRFDPAKLHGEGCFCAAN